MNIIKAYILSYNFLEIQKEILKITTTRKFNYKNINNNQQEIELLKLLNTFEILAILNAIIKSTK